MSENNQFKVCPSNKSTRWKYQNKARSCEWRCLLDLKTSLPICVYFIQLKGFNGPLKVTRCKLLSARSNHQGDLEFPPHKRKGLGRLNLTVHFDHVDYIWIHYKYLKVRVRFGCESWGGLNFEFSLNFEQILLILTKVCRCHIMCISRKQAKSQFLPRESNLSPQTTQAKTAPWTQTTKYQFQYSDEYSYQLCDNHIIYRVKVFSKLHITHSIDTGRVSFVSS